jgi:hypothetical protein
VQKESLNFQQEAIQDAVFAEDHVLFIENLVYAEFVSVKKHIKANCLALKNQVGKEEI